MQDDTIGADAAAQDKRAKAFRNAARHSSRVRLLRRFIVLGSTAAVTAIALVTLLDPFRVVGAAISISGAGLEGSRITMQQPKMSGFQKDGRAYSMRATAGVQDVRKPTVIELVDLQADIGLPDNAKARITSPKGVYDSTAEAMDMGGPVRMKSDTGYDLTMQSAHIEFKSNRLTSKEPVSLVTNSGTIRADAMEVSDSGHRITFEGNVESMLLPAGEGKATANSLKGALQ